MITGTKETKLWDYQIKILFTWAPVFQKVLFLFPILSISEVTSVLSELMHNTIA